MSEHNRRYPEHFRVELDHNRRGRGARGGRVGNGVGRHGQDLGQMEFFRFEMMMTMGGKIDPSFTLPAEPSPGNAGTAVCVRRGLGPEQTDEHEI